MRVNKLVTLIMVGSMVLTACGTPEKKTEGEKTTVVTTVPETQTKEETKEIKTTEVDTTKENSDAVDWSSKIGTWYADEEKSMDYISIKDVQQVLLDDQPEPREYYSKITMELFLYRIASFEESVLIADNSSNSFEFEATEDGTSNRIKGTITFEKDTLIMDVTDSTSPNVSAGTQMKFPYYDKKIQATEGGEQEEQTEDIMSEYTDVWEDVKNEKWAKLAKKIDAEKENEDEQGEEFELKNVYYKSESDLSGEAIIEYEKLNGKNHFIVSFETMKVRLGKTNIFGELNDSVDKNMKSLGAKKVLSKKNRRVFEYKLKDKKLYITFVSYSGNGFIDQIKVNSNYKDDFFEEYGYYYGNNKKDY